MTSITEPQVIGNHSKNSFVVYFTNLCNQSTSNDGNFVINKKSTGDTRYIIRNKYNSYFSIIKTNPLSYLHILITADILGVLCKIQKLQLIKKIYLFLIDITEERERERSINDEKESSISCLLYASYWGLGPYPRNVP